MPRVTELSMRALSVASMAKSASGLVPERDFARARFTKTPAKKTTTTV